MSINFDLDSNYLLNGDCFKVIPELKDDSLDLVLTDFPYGISFMGKAWDNCEEGFFEKVGKVLFPKMKAGSFLVTTFTPRMDMLWRCLSELEKAGFEMKTSPMFWLYHTGFPKAGDMSKQIDKQKGLTGKIINPKTYPDIRSNNYGNSQGTTRLSGGDYIAENEESKAWSGFKSFQLKPSVEVVICVQKPRTEKTIVGQVLANGCGSVNIEKCRIPYSSESDISVSPQKDTSSWHGNSWSKNPQINNGEVKEFTGRFPANLLVSGEPLKGYSKSGTLKGVYGGFGNSSICYGDSEKANANYSKNEGSPNRFYSLDAWWEKRNITLTEESAFFDVPKPSKAEKNKGCEVKDYKSKRPSGVLYNKEEPDGFRDTLKQNSHPTTKPIKLFTYLTELFSKKGDTVLDCFMGSGTTGIACSVLGRKFIGIEKEKDYFEIARARIREQQKQSKIWGEFK